MRIEGKIFEICGIFLLFIFGIYSVWTIIDGELEWVGAIGLLFSALMSFMISSFLRFTFKRSDLRPEDYKDAEISDSAGILGFFSPSSFWPLLIALAVAIVGISVALYLLWLAVIGAVFLIFSVGGLVFEYQIGVEKH